MKRHGTVGKIVKHINLSVTQPDLTQVSTKIAVRFSTDGWFRIDLPEHITAWFKGRTLPFEDSGRLNYHAGELSAKTLESVESALSSSLQLYKGELKDHERVKKLVVTFQANYRGPRKSGGITIEHTTMQEISSMGFGGAFSGSQGGNGPALGLGYEVLWQIGDGLYRVHPSHEEGRPPQMTRMCSVPKQDRPRHSTRSMFILDWTEEREAFFAHATENMNVLIFRIAQLLLGDTTSNVDRLIATGGGMLALPSPSTENPE